MAKDVSKVFRSMVGHGEFFMESWPPVVSLDMLSSPDLFSGLVVVHCCV